MDQRVLRTLIVTVIILAIAIWVILPANPGIHFAGINKDIQTRLGLDLVGGVQALLEADMPPGATITAEQMQTATRIVENRVNGLGVTEAVVQQAGESRIVVELPGETDPEKALAAIKGTGLLEFVDFTQLSNDEIFALEGSQATINTDFAQGAAGSAPTPQPTQVPITSTATVTSTTSSAADQTFHTIMTGADLKQINVVTNPTSSEPEVSFVLTDAGAKIFADFTSQNVGKVLAIVLDKKIISAPRINSPITDGQGVIQGNFTIESANELAVQLRYGSLPIPLKVVDTRTIGPTLGQDSLQKSLVAGLIGSVIVILFMSIYYRLPGIVAVLAILTYAVVAYAVFRFVPVTLTLPGIAGFLLSTGSALDANILIFERMKEELRSGRNLRQALDLGWQRAWPSIRDSNIATLITCTILFWFGSQYGATIVKGFSLTLFLGVLISLFTALVVTRALLATALQVFKPTNLTRWFGI